MNSTAGDTRVGPPSYECEQTLSLDSDVLELLEACINSHAKLEIMRCMHQLEHVNRTALLANAAIDQEHDAFDEVLAELVADRLLETSDDGTIHLGASSRIPTLGKLVRAYETDSAAILSELSTIALGRIRKMAASAHLEQLLSTRKRSND